MSSAEDSVLFAVKLFIVYLLSQQIYHYIINNDKAYTTIKAVNPINKVANEYTLSIVFISAPKLTDYKNKHHWHEIKSEPAPIDNT